MGNRLTICATCAAAGDAPQGAALADAVAAKLPAGWEVVLHDCLSMCDEPTAIALQGDGRATYLFAGVTVDDADDLRGLLALYDAAPDGWIADARPAGQLRMCLRGRVPA